MVKDKLPQKSPYRILEKIGQGAMGIVYRGEDVNLGREVALKFLPEDLISDPQKKKRFIQEARAAAALNHPNIATVYGIHEVDGDLFIAMELVEGVSLKDKIERGDLTTSESAAIIRQVALGLQAAADVARRAVQQTSRQAARRRSAQESDAEDPRRPRCSSE